MDDANTNKPVIGKMLYFTVLAIVSLSALLLLPATIRGQVPESVSILLLLFVLGWGLLDPRFYRTSLRNGLWRRRK